MPACDISISQNINNLANYYIVFSTIGVLINIIQFLFHNFFVPERNDSEVRQLRDQVDNLHTILEEVVKFVNRGSDMYAEEQNNYVKPIEKEETTVLESPKVTKAD